MIFLRDKKDEYCHMECWPSTPKWEEWKQVQTLEQNLKWVRE